LVIWIDLSCHRISHLTDAVEFLGGILLLNVRQKSLESNFCKLLIRQNQTKAPVLNIPEPLNEGSDRFIIPLPQVGQIGQLHLLYTRIEELVELFLQIGPEYNGVGWQCRELCKGRSRERHGEQSHLQCIVLSCFSTLY